MKQDEMAFLEQIRRQPADDAPRLVFSDWLEEHGDPDRAEFIRVQCSLARVREGEPHFEELRTREQQLLAAHASAWLGPLHEVVAEWGEESNYWEGKWAFERGFLSTLVLRAATFLDHAELIASCAPLLQGLVLRDFDDDPQRLAQCPSLQRLRELGLYRSFGDAAIRALVASPYLTSLHTLALASTGLGEEGVRSLAVSPLLERLRALDLFGNNLGDVGAAILSSSPAVRNLKWLGYSWTGLGFHGLRHFTSSPFLADLEGLNIDAGVMLSGHIASSRNPLGVEGCELLAASPYLHRLKVLHLHDQQIGDAGLKVLAAAPSLAGLNKLHLGHNGITAEGARSLATLPFPAQLTALDLSHNAIGPAGAQALAASPKLTALCWLQLDGCQLGDKGLIALAAAPMLQSVTTLFLSSNEIGDTGIQRLAASRSFAQLATLFLYDHRLTDKGAVALAEAESLRRLGLSAGFSRRVAAMLNTRFGNQAVTYQTHSAWRTLANHASLATRAVSKGVNL